MLAEESPAQFKRPLAPLRVITFWSAPITPHSLIRTRALECLSCQGHDSRASSFTPQESIHIAGHDGNTEQDEKHACDCGPLHGSVHEFRR